MYTATKIITSTFTNNTYSFIVQGDSEESGGKRLIEGYLMLHVNKYFPFGGLFPNSKERYEKIARWIVGAYESGRFTNNVANSIRTNLKTTMDEGLFECISHLKKWDGIVDQYVDAEKEF